MATILKDDALAMVERCEKQTRPKVYCIIRYENLFTGDWNYAYYAGPRAQIKFEEATESPAVGFVEVLFGSERFRRDFPAYLDDELEEDAK